MFASITCPACRHKFTIPEGAMGKSHTCPNCHSPFLAGKSVAAGDVPMKFEPAPAAAINKTMLGETEPPIRYNCPRCKKPLESPAIEAGTKKPCPACGGRLQVPAAPPPQPGLNKTILASDEGNAAFRAAAPPPFASVQAPAATVPAAGAEQSRGSNMKTYAIVGGIAAGVVFLLLLTCIVSAVMRNNSHEQALANAKQEFEKLKADIAQKQALMEQKLQMEAEYQKTLNAERQAAAQKQAELQREIEATLKSGNLAEKEKAAFDQRKRDLEQDKMDREARQQKDAQALQQQIAALKAQVEAGNQKAQVIISQPPPPVYYPWHPRYYYGW
jgi:DNA-directed RNA polymerase subunit RPC12/RpoP